MPTTKTLLFSTRPDAAPATPPSGYTCPITPDTQAQITGGKFSLQSDAYATGIWVDNTNLTGTTIESEIVLNNPVDVGSGINVFAGFFDSSGNGWALLVGNVAGGYFRVFLYNAWVLTGAALATDTTAPINGATITFRRNTSTGAMTAYQNGAALAGISYSSLTYDPRNAAVGSRRTTARVISLASRYTQPQEITSINSGNPVKVGQTGISFALGGSTGFSGVPTAGSVSYYNAAKGSTQTLTLTNISGNATSCTADLEDRSEGVDYPAYGDTLTFTLTRGAESASGTQTLALKTGELTVTFASAVTNDDSFLTYWFNALGYTVEGAKFDYVTGTDNVVFYADGSWVADRATTTTGWLRPENGMGEGNEYFFTITLNDGVVIVQQGLTSSGLTSSGLTSYGLTDAGL